MGGPDPGTADIRCGRTQAGQRAPGPGRKETPEHNRFRGFYAMAGLSREVLGVLLCD